MAVSELPGGNDGKSTITRRTKKKGASSRMSDGMDIQYRFNALRFLAMNLKSLSVMTPLDTITFK